MSDYRYQNHWNYIEKKKAKLVVTDNNSTQLNHAKNIKNAINKIQDKNTISSNNSNIHKWPRKTVLVASDSMMSQLDEQRLSREGYNVKVRSFKGSTISDMYFYLYPLLQKEPDYLILHVGTNNCVYHSSGKVFDDLLALKSHIEVKIPGIKVILSQPIARYDDNALACVRVQHLIRKLTNANVYLMVNSNIIRKHIGKKGLHFNGYGTARCAMNIISLIKKL